MKRSLKIDITNKVNLSNEELALATAILERDVRALVLDDLNLEIERLVTEREIQSHIMILPEMEEIAKTQTCPVAYALALHAGYNPAIIMLFDRVNQEVGVVLSGWPNKLIITSGDTNDDVVGPLAPGMLWGVNPHTDMAEIWVKPEYTGLPETIFAQLPDRFTGRPLQEMVSHPVTDSINIRIRKFVCTDGGDCKILIEGAPSLKVLRQVINETASNPT